ncbi:MAG: hypothetical protein U1E34_05890 [Amaricoccus sp.]
MRRWLGIALCLAPLTACGIKGDPTPAIPKVVPQASLPATEQ